MGLDTKRKKFAAVHPVNGVINWYFQSSQVALDFCSAEGATLEQVTGFHPDVLDEGFSGTVTLDGSGQVIPLAWPYPPSPEETAAAAAEAELQAIVADPQPSSTNIQKLAQRICKLYEPTEE